MEESKITVRISRDTPRNMLRELRLKTDDWVNTHNFSPADDQFRLIGYRDLHNELELTYEISKSVNDPKSGQESQDSPEL